MEERLEQLVPPRSLPPTVPGAADVRPVPQPIPPNPAQEEAGIMAAPRQLTNRMFDALDEVGDWVLGR
jgi:hypothetical protein